MKLMRNVVVVIAVFAVLATACSAKKGTQASDEKTIAILMHSVADEFIYSVYAAADARAKELGYKTLFVDSKNDAAAQTAAIEDVITQKVAGIMLCPVDAAALSDSVIKISGVKIPVTMADRTVNEGSYVAVCQSDNYQFGYEGANQIVAAAKKLGKNAADLKILELQGDLSSTSGLERSKGFQKAAADLGLKIASSLPTYWRTDTASNAALDALQANPGINAIFLASDGVMADAVVNVLEQINRLYPTEDPRHIIITTVDGTPAVHEQIKKRYIDAVCAQPAILMAETAINKLDEAIKGKIALNANENIALAPTIGTIDNIDSPELWANAKKK